LASSPSLPALFGGRDHDFLMTTGDDACATCSEACHNDALYGIRGRCRVRSTDQVLEELLAQRRNAVV